MKFVKCFILQLKIQETFDNKLKSQTDKIKTDHC